MPSDVEKMFSDFQARKLREKEAQDESAAKHQAFRDKAISVINQHIAPALRGISVELKQHGHESEVSLVVDNCSYPSVNLSFRLISKKPHTNTTPSLMTFATTTSEDRVEVRTEIWGAKGKDESHSYRGAPNFKLLDEVTEKWVKAQTLSFVGSVLSKH